MATVVIKLFVLFTVFMLAAMLPNQFAVEKTAISYPNYYIAGNPVPLVRRVLVFFSFQVKITWKFISTSAAQYFWLTAVPSAFLSISTAEIASATAAVASADAAIIRSVPFAKLNTHLHWRFIIIGVWWTTMLAYFLDLSIRNVYGIVINCYPAAMFGRSIEQSNEKWVTIATIVGVLVLKIVLIKIYWRMVVAFVGRRTINCRLKMPKSK